jgi:hypothetical protein
MALYGRLLTGPHWPSRAILQPSDARSQETVAHEAAASATLRGPGHRDFSRRDGGRISHSILPFQADTPLAPLGS